MCRFFWGQIANLPSGAGTEGEPYQIATWENLYWISQNSDEWGKYFEQTQDITFPTDVSDGIQTWDEGKGWKPIGWYIGEEEEISGTFSGVYDGGGHTISKLFINRSDKDFIGLFGRMTGTSGQMAELKNIRLVDVTITGEWRVGSLLGKIDDNQYVTITNCSANGGTVKGVGTTGGLVGANNGFPSGNPTANRSKMFFCWANVNVSYIGTSEGIDIKIGGLVGCNQRGETYDSFALGDVVGTNSESYYADRVGGFAGCIIQGLVERSFSYGTVTASEDANSKGAFVGLVGGGGTGGVAPDCYYNSEDNDLGGDGTGLTKDQFGDEDLFPNYDFEDTWQMSEDGYPELKGNPKSNIFTGNLPYDSEVNKKSFYKTENHPNKETYVSLLTNRSQEKELSINVSYSENPDVLDLEGLANPENLGGYYKFFCADFSILRNAQYVEFQLPLETPPMSIYYRVKTHDQTTAWLTVPDAALDGPNVPDYTYKVTISELAVPEVQQREVEDEGHIEFASDNGDAPLPVTLNFFEVQYVGNDAELTWQTSSETNNIGWNVYRSENSVSPDLQLNSNLIQGAGTTSQTTDYSFIDPYLVVPGKIYYYWLESVDEGGVTELFGPQELEVPDLGVAQPISTRLYANYPNPFNPDTNIKFSLKEASHVTLVIYNIRGQRLITLIDEEYDSGYHSVTWDGLDEMGRKMPSGIYYYRFISLLHRDIKKMLLLK